MGSFAERNVEIILAHQHPFGAYPASPNFPIYRYCWFRDGSYIAYAMDLVSKHASARRFHDWAVGALLRRIEVIHRAISKAENDQPLSSENILHTRYTVGGEEGDDEWPNFQLDGFGTWLWALAEHLRLTGTSALPDSWRQAVDLIAEYLNALWQYPCFDLWEEFPDHVHPHTLAAIYGGLNAHSRMTGVSHQTTLEKINAALSMNSTQFGHFTKLPGSPSVDASLLGLAVPYAAVALDDPVMLATVAQIEKTLVCGGGLHRYAADTYYGGGEWLLLTAWLGWYYCKLADKNKELASQALEKARSALLWVEQQAGIGAKAGWLPEQVAHNLNATSYYPLWLARWGEIANPLLWSHAKYIILEHHLQQVDQISQ